MSDEWVTNPELIKRLQAIDNGTLKNDIMTGGPQEIAVEVTDTLSGGELATIVDGNYEVPIRDGQVNFLHYEGTNFYDAPTTSTTSIQKTVPAGPITQYNSNETSIQRGKYTQAYNTSVDSNNKVNLSGQPKSGSFGTNAAYFLGAVNQAVAATSVGIMLGKTIDGALYSANPDYWDSIGLSTLDPTTWNSITHGDDSLGSSLFNMIFGLDPNTGKAQAYIDQNAFAYMAYALAQNGFFSGEGKSYSDIDISPATQPISVGYSADGNFYYKNSSGTTVHFPIGTGLFAVFPCNSTTQSGRTWAGACGITDDPNAGRGQQWTYNGKTVYYNNLTYTGNSQMTRYNGDWQISPAINGLTVFSRAGTLAYQKLAWIALYGTGGAIEGVGDQQGATLPDVSNWNDLASTLADLATQFPQLLANALKYDQLQPDGSLKETTYVPVGWPETLANPWTDTKPTISGTTSTQAQPAIDLDDLPDTETSPLTRTITQTPTPSPTTPVPQNPSDTGSGDSPTPTVPAGSASALWSVYHPSQAQVNAFGAWLWTDNIITQIQQVLQNPMEGIITLHKVFATPTDAGNGTIVVGRLDSQVPSALVTQQYVEVDCGSVDCHEDFGCVFDYSPFTKASLYLPFIGIVPLNVDEVMRSTLHVTYGVDVFTGACLARVEVTRDANTVNLYQYAGVASVEYPLTGSVHGGLLSGIIGAASGAIGIGLAATGAGMAAGAAAMVGGFSSAIKSSNAHSGAFSGNAGAMGIKKPYLILERPQTKIAETFPVLDGRPTNYSVRLGDCFNHVVCKTVHVSGISATRAELELIESLLKEGVEI